MAGFEVASSPVLMEESLEKDVMERKEAKPDRPRREPEEVPDMTVEEAHKALNALSKVGTVTRYNGSTRTRPRIF